MDESNRFGAIRSQLILRSVLLVPVVAGLGGFAWLWITGSFGVLTNTWSTMASGALLFVVTAALVTMPLRQVIPSLWRAARLKSDRRNSVVLAARDIIYREPGPAGGEAKSVADFASITVSRRGEVTLYVHGIGRESSVMERAQREVRILVSEVDRWYFGAVVAPKIQVTGGSKSLEFSLVSLNPLTAFRSGVRRTRRARDAISAMQGLASN